MEENEYYYIDFKDIDIYSWSDEKSELDNANKFIGNTFASYQDAKKWIEDLLAKQSID